MPSNTDPTPAPSPVDNQLEADLKAWLEAQMQLQQDKKELQKMLMLLQLGNPLLWAQEVMLQMMQIQGDQVAGLAAIDNIDSDLRSEVTGQEGDMNNQSSGPDQKSMQKFLDSINALEDFLKKQQGLGKDSVLDPAGIKNMIDSLDSIKKTFGSDWGNAANMTKDVANWVNESNQGKNSPELAAIRSNLSTLMQSTSAFSTATTTKLQYNTQVFQQIEGITNDTMQAFQKLEAGFVNNQKSGV